MLSLFQQRCIPSDITDLSTYWVGGVGMGGGGVAFSWLIVPRLQKTLEAVLETEIAINKTECMYDQTIVK